MSMETRGRVSPSANSPSEGYEHRDANTRSLFKYGLGLAVILVIVLWSMKWMFSYFAKTQPLGPPASPFENARVLPPQPRLQAKPRADLRNYCGEQMQELNSYEWVDPQNGVLRIPIDRAMEVTIEHGLPARSASEAQSAGARTSSQIETQSSPNGPCAYWIGENENAKSQDSEK